MPDLSRTDVRHQPFAEVAQIDRPPSPTGGDVPENPLCLDL